MMNKLIGKSQVCLRKNAPTILTCMGGVGVVATTVTAIKATPKAVRLLDTATALKGEELTNLEKIKMVGPLYIPTIALGVTTIVCIFGANALNKRQQASLMSAYALIDSSFKEYKNKVKELYGEDGAYEIMESVAEDKYENEPDPNDGTILFYDEFSGRFFRSTMEKVTAAEYQINREISMKYAATINDFYDLLGIDRIDGGDELGWSSGMNFEAYWQEWVDFTNRKATLEDGTEYRSIVIFQEPLPGFEEY